MKKVLSLFLCLFLVLSVTGCAGTGSEEKETNIAFSASPSTIDPQLCSEITCLRAVSLYMSTLFTYDDNHALVPGLAEKYDSSPDGLKYTFHLRKGLKWSDGTPLTAHDFVFALRRLADPETGSGSVYMITESCQIKNVEEVLHGKKRTEELGVSAPDEHTFIIELEQPCPFLPSLLSSYVFSPCNEKFYKKCKDNYATSPETILSCGPYVVDRYEPLAQQIHYSKNPNYYEEKHTEKIPAGITIQVVSNYQQAVMCFDTGQFDVVGLNNDLLQKMAGNKDLHSIMTARLQFVAFGNLSQSPGKNVHIRKALGRSIDRESIVKDYMRAGAYALARISPRDYYKETDGSDFSPDDKAYQGVTGYDLSAAQKEWKQGLQELGTDKIELKLAYYNNEQSLCEIFKQEWEKNLPGLSIKMVSLPMKEWLNSINHSDYDLIYQGWTADYPDPTGFFVFWATDSHGKDGYSDKKTDQMIDESGSAEMAVDPAKRNKLLHEIEDRLLSDMAMIPLFGMETSFLVSEKYKKFSLNPIGTGYMISGLIPQK